MFQPIRTMIDRYRETRALDALTDRDLADLGMSREQVAHFIRMPADTPDRVVAMARIFGLSEGEIKRDHGEWIDLVEVCAEALTARLAGFCSARAIWPTHATRPSAPTTRPLNSIGRPPEFTCPPALRSP
jgi:hypothetical protein